MSRHCANITSAAVWSRGSILGCDQQTEHKMCMHSTVLTSAHLVAVHVKAVGAIDAFKDDRLTSHRLKRAHWGINATRQQRLRLSKNLQPPQPKLTQSINNLNFLTLFLAMTTSIGTLVDCLIAGAARWPLRGTIAQLMRSDSPPQTSVY